jgi:mgtE-like transporter
VACIGAVSISIPITSILAIETYKRGLDPDILVYPILASINDVVVTVFFMLTIFTVLKGGVYFTFLVTIYIVILAIISYIGYNNISNAFFIQTIKEGFFVVIMSSVFGGMNGVFLSRLSKNLSKSPGLVVLYPALTNALGNIGSIIGSKTTTNMALGYARTFKEELMDAGVSIVQVEVPAAFMHIVFAILSFFIVGKNTLNNNLSFLIAVSIMSNLISFLVISIFALFSAYQAFQRGLNPDNIVIPAITSISDTTATLSVTPAIFVAHLIGL